MILKQAITLINERLEGANLSARPFGLCEIIKRTVGTNTQTFPAEYLNNEWKSVSEFDKNLITTYWRKTGSVTTTIIESPHRACAKWMTFVYPLRLVMAVQMGKIDGFSEDEFFERVAAVIIGRYDISQVSQAELIITNYSTDRAVILAQEYVGIETKFQHNYALLGVNCNLVAHADPECLIKNTLQ